jgi:hypothetical protein
MSHELNPVLAFTRIYSLPKGMINKTIKIQLHFSDINQNSSTI